MGEQERPIDPPEARGPRDGDLPAYVSNGLIGLRVREMPLRPGMALVSGLVGEHPESRIEAAAAAPYPLAADIAINGIWLDDQPWAVSDLRQSYDFSCGELTSRFRFTAGEIRVAVKVTTFASRTAPTLVLQEVEVTPEAACDLTFRAAVDIAGVRGRVSRRQVGALGATAPCSGSLLWETDGELSQCGVALLAELAGADDESALRPRDASGSLVTEHRARAGAGRTLRLRQMAALAPSIVHARPHEEAIRRLARGKAAGFDELRRCNREAWSELWKSRIVVHGAPPEHQALIDAAFFYLNSSVHPASPSSTSIFGLATWHGYHYYFGHVMWDVDAFCMPPVMVMQPRAARAMLDFRSRTRRAARSTARLSNRDGIQFPWQAAPMTGQEAAPEEGSAAHHEDHVSLHVARAFSLYADISGDEAFLEEDAWPVVRGVADWFVSRTTRTGRGVEMLHSMGPAEVPEPPDNDAFSLMAGAEVLRRAIGIAQRLKREVPDSWRATLRDLYLPVRADGVIASHDGFRVDEPKGETPSPLAGLFPYGYPAPETQTRKTLEFYLAQWPRYVGAPMLPALYSVWACMAGDRELARKLFEEGYAAYDHPRFHQCLEYRTDHEDSQVPAGPFFANLGGLLLGLIYGYAGLEIDDGDPAAWPRRPVVLPRGWDSIEIGRLWVRGRPARLIARQGADRAELEPL